MAHRCRIVSIIIGANSWEGGVLADYSVWGHYKHANFPEFLQFLNGLPVVVRSLKASFSDTL